MVLRTTLHFTATNHVCCSSLYLISFTLLTWKLLLRFFGSLIAGFVLSLSRPDPCGSEQPIHRQRPVAAQLPLRDCVDHLEQLLPTYMQHLELKLDSNKVNLTVEGHRLNNLPVPSMPWRPCTNLCFFLLNINYRQINSTQLISNITHSWIKDVKL